MITGPIHVAGAEPGDVLEIEILSIETRVPWGVNSTSARGGVFSTSYPGYAEGDPALDIPPGTRHVIRTGEVDGREVAFFSDDIQVPLAPFMGILAVAPDPVVGQPGVTVPGVQGSRPPGPFGGNLDVKDLKAGTTVYLPVFHPGALFYVGDPHGAQGDGEVSGTAIEQSLTGTFRLRVHKDRSITGPRAENDEHYVLMGIDLDLDRAARHAVWEVVNFLVEEKGLSPAKALVAGEHRGGLPHQRSGGPDSGGVGVHSEGRVPAVGGKGAALESPERASAENASHPPMAIIQIT